MSRKTSYPPMPNIQNPIHKDYEEISSEIGDKEKSQIQKYIQQKYVEPIAKREKSSKRSIRAEWFWTKGATLLNIILALIAAITGIISLLK